MRRLMLPAASLLLVAVTACGGNGATTTTTGGTGTTAAGQSSTTSAPVATTTTTEAPAEPYFPGLDLAEIRQLTPTSGGGTHPTLAWEAVEGAAGYTVIVFDGDGAPWWSWQGTDTEVVIGGFATESPAGPKAGPGVTWVVFASDADGNPIAVGAQRPLDA